MKFYFQLQYRRFKRWFQEIGIPPYLGMALILPLFVVGSKVLFLRSEFAVWIYTGLALWLCFDVMKTARTELLEQLFKKRDFYLIRILENGLLILPFMGYLLYEHQRIPALILLVAGVGFALLKLKRAFRFKLATPFKKFPFEWIVGFRKTYGLLLVLYFLTFKSIQIQNFNLGAFALGFISLLGMSYYYKPEPQIYVWVFAQKAATFLKQKILIGWLGSIILGLPILISMGIAYPDRLWILLIVHILGGILLSTFVLAKYSAYPQEINIPQFLLFMLSFWFPPMLVVTIPIFYRQAVRKLKPILQ